MKFIPLCFLFLLSIVYPLGHFSGNAYLTQIGLLTASSPFPFVFTSFGDQYDYWAAQVDIKMETVEGKVHHIPPYPGSMEKFGIHHMTQVFHVLPITLSYLAPQQHTAWQTRAFFCNPEGLFMRHLGISGEKVKNYKFIINPASPKQEAKEFEFACL